MKIATFNLRIDVASDGRNAWPFRLPSLRAFLQAEDWDAIGTQEGNLKMLEGLMPGIPRFSRIGLPRFGEDETCAILYDPSRLRKADSGTFWLSGTPDEVSRFSGSHFLRICTWAEFLPSGKSLSGCSTPTSITRLRKSGSGRSKSCWRKSGIWTPSVPFRSSSPEISTRSPMIPASSLSGSFVYPETGAFCPPPRRRALRDGPSTASRGPDGEIRSIMSGSLPISAALPPASGPTPVRRGSSFRTITPSKRISKTTRFSLWGKSRKKTAEVFDFPRPIVYNGLR